MISAEQLAHWKKLFRTHRVTILTLMGLIGIACIFFADFSAEEREGASTESLTDASIACTATSYELQLEQRLAAILSQMEGVGTVEVMVTVSGSSEEVFAQEVKQVQGEHNAQTEQKPIITKQENEESGLLTKTTYPNIQGVAILCSGGRSAVVREQICKAVSTMLGIPITDIYVGSHAESPIS